MIDELLGRATLKERIEELEAEADRLRKRYEAESERRADAATARQAAEREQNRLEDRIAQLEGELERQREAAASADEGGLEPRRRDRLRGRELRTVIDRLESFQTGPEGALTVVLGPGDVPPSTLEDLLGSRVTLLEDDEPWVVCVDDALVMGVALSPPIPPGTDANGHGAQDAGPNPTPPHLEWGDRFDLPTASLLPEGQFTLALLRADLFAMGVYDGEEQVSSHGFESEVKGSHSKGGFSQGRFERIREGQIADHLDRSRRALEERQSGPCYLVGQRDVVEELAERVEPDATAAVDATGKPKPALEDAFRDFFTTELVVF